ncbi:LptF/LptG family permease [Blochmannia endosymbiont of Colobopsis nipponica]|uniref:LptF/LptG family permease n=1 Tax=Blochmannia endosymbiont of Colobopsis nipponica TaxID=2681987 RepID=UPI001784608C|nr:LptF/LptG family permease [Blochmannia endosymbiont of Colobopsis nipponica]QOI10811.1 LptF/LptG family permease [Blochmannia endosymbiont of Colobopsis nipponica]
MIITRYLIKAILKNQLIIFLVLLVVFFCQKFVKVLSILVENNVSIFYIFFLVFLSLVDVLKFILPFSLFLGLLITFKNFYMEHEIIGIYTCGLGKFYIMRTVSIFTIFIVVFLAVHIFWVSPWSSYYRDKFLFDLKYRFSALNIISGKFYFLDKRYLLFFISDIKKKFYFKNIFIVKFQPIGNNVSSLISAHMGFIDHLQNGDEYLVLNDGVYYEWFKDTDVFSNFFVTNFFKYKLLLTSSKRIYRSIKVDQMSIHELWDAGTLEANVELHWRFTLIISVWIMSMIATSLSVSCLHKYSLMSWSFGLILYFFFFTLQVSLRFYGVKNNLDHLVLFIWLTNIVYCIIFLAINYNDFVVTCKMSEKFLKV